MKINKINNSCKSPFFGMKITKTQGFDDFMQKTRGINWKCPEEDIQNFVTKLEDMHFSQEEKEATSIVFYPSVKEFAGYRTFQSHTTSRKFVNEPCYITVMPYSFYKTGNSVPKTAKYAVPLNNSSLDDVLIDIASNYAKYTYSNQ